MYLTFNVTIINFIIVGCLHKFSVSQLIFPRLCATVDNIDSFFRGQITNKSLCVVFSIINHIGDNETICKSRKLMTHVLLLAAVGSL